MMCTGVWLLRCSEANICSGTVAWSTSAVTHSRAMCRDVAATAGRPLIDASQVQIALAMAHPSDAAPSPATTLVVMFSPA
jgi:hypothetical protein